MRLIIRDVRLADTVLVLQEWLCKDELIRSSCEAGWWFVACVYVWFPVSSCTNEVKVCVNVKENHILASSRPNISVGRRRVRVIYPCSTHVFLITKC